MKKQLKVFLAVPVLLIMAIVTLAFRQATPPLDKATTHVWYVLSPGGDPEEPTDYVRDDNFNPETQGCNGSVYICAILALPGTNTDYPDISGDPEQDPNVSDVEKRNTP